MFHDSCYFIKARFDLVTSDTSSLPYNGLEMESATSGTIKRLDEFDSRVDEPLAIWMESTFASVTLYSFSVGVDFADLVFNFLFKLVILISN